MPLSFHSLLESFPNATLAEAILVLTSVSSRILLLTLLPRYLKVSTGLMAVSLMWMTGLVSVTGVDGLSCDMDSVFVRLMVRPKRSHEFAKRFMMCCMSSTEWAARAQSSANRNSLSRVADTFDLA